MLRSPARPAPAPLPRSSSRACIRRNASSTRSSSRPTTCSRRSTTRGCSRVASISRATCSMSTDPASSNADYGARTSSASRSGSAAGGIARPTCSRGCKAAVEQAIRGEPFRGVSTYFWADGSSRVVDFACMPITDDAGNVQMVVPTGMDITERVGSIRNLHAMDILESITEGFFGLDREWRFTYLNGEAQRVLGRTLNELVGKVIWDAYPDLVGSEFEQAYRRAMTDHEPSTVVAYYPDHDRWYEVHPYPATDGISVYFRNVTEQKRADRERERLIAASERERRIYEAALSNTPDLVYVFDLDHRFIYANEALLRDVGSHARGCARQDLSRAGLRAMARGDARPRDRAGRRHAPADTRRGPVHRHQRPPHLRLHLRARGRARRHDRRRRRHDARRHRAAAQRAGHPGAGAAPARGGPCQGRVPRHALARIAQPARAAAQLARAAAACPQHRGRHRGRSTR